MCMSMWAVLRGFGKSRHPERHLAPVGRLVFRKEVQKEKITDKITGNFSPISLTISNVWQQNIQYQSRYCCCIHHEVGWRRDVQLEAECGYSHTEGPHKGGRESTKPCSSPTSAQLAEQHGK